MKHLVREPSKLRGSLFGYLKCAREMMQTKGPGRKRLWAHSNQKGCSRAPGSSPVEGDKPEAQALPTNRSTSHTRFSCSLQKAAGPAWGQAVFKGIRGDRSRGCCPALWVSHLGCDPTGAEHMGLFGMGLAGRWG